MGGHIFKVKIRKLLYLLRGWRARVDLWICHTHTQHGPLEPASRLLGITTYTLIEFTIFSRGHFSPNIRNRKKELLLLLLLHSPLRFNFFE